MMSGLFSIFDPSTGFGLSLNWIALLIGLCFLPLSFWVLPTRWMVSWSMINKTVLKELSSLFSSSSPSGMSVLVLGLFWFIIFSNFLGLFPYVFTSTAHILVTLSLAFPMWMGFMLFGWLTRPIDMLAHLVPEGTPTILMMFMVCIETISNLIRPITLSVRLAANMIAGHLLLTLLGSQGVSASMVILTLILVTQFFLLLLEAAVAVIQSYVFVVLTTLYSAEVY
ncbi:ATP synthase F0 subunit 6 (mitochondrion) [Priapulus caudatus]|uniref:ATP synthase subunit a n=1 Tax=Priapulus caudatus TaxID=37621 RepID=A0MCU9_PRICU|nr:ATP synthase F0 subunit 6 [Priapulus caudatus]ABE03644.1 ATP synthase F0 subunit 6 [Priapulus caudatus]